MVLTFFIDSTSPQKVIFTIYLNIEYWGDDAATREDVTVGEGDMEDVTGEGDMEKGEREAGAA